ncbi:MAG: DegT/DnrJ/EryC1/StrS family aminotransferase [Bacillota bacterium]
MFVDIEVDTANTGPNLIENAVTPRTKAILPVDAFGQPDGRAFGHARGRADVAHRRDHRQARVSE